MTSLQSTTSSRGAVEQELLTSSLTIADCVLSAVGHNEMKQNEAAVRLDVRKRFFIDRVVSHWNKLPREVVMTPNLREHLEDDLI